MGKFTLIKMFDCEAMPENVKEEFFNQYERDNGSIVECCVYDYMYPEKEHPEGGEIVYRDGYTGHVCKKGVDILADWLHENGAEIHENVLIKYWIA